MIRFPKNSGPAVGGGQLFPKPNSKPIKHSVLKRSNGKMYNRTHRKKVWYYYKIATDDEILAIYKTRFGEGSWNAVDKHLDRNSKVWCWYPLSKVDYDTLQAFGVKEIIL